MRLRTARASAPYAAVYDDPEPLVSVVIPTYDHPEELLERSLPSVLGQTYERLDVIVLGDAAAPEVGAAVEALGDGARALRQPPPSRPDPDPLRQWLVGSVAARNAGHELAQGAWLVDFDDDDELRPRAVELGLALAREQRVEVAYGPFVLPLARRPDETMGGVPAGARAVRDAGRAGARRAALLRALAGRRRVRRAQRLVPHRRDAARRACASACTTRSSCDYYPSLRGRPELRTPGSPLTAAASSAPRRRAPPAAVPPTTRAARASAGPRPRGRTGRRGSCAT